MRNINYIFLKFLTAKTDLLNITVSHKTAVYENVTIMLEDLV
jgi:hypothetical protein